MQMSEFTNWRDVKAKARELDPTWDDPARVEQRRQIRDQMMASVSGARLAELRKQLGMTQVQLGKATGLTQARISQIEHGQAVSLDALRTYIAGLGGQIDVVARVGGIQINLAYEPGSALGEALEGTDGDIGPGRVPERRKRSA
jgi:transcriptional regulator with XRE-family HTH domain